MCKKTVAIAMMRTYEAIVAGVSSGGFDALHAILPALPANLRVPVIVVQHQLDGSDEYLPNSLDEKSALAVKPADDGEPLEPGVVYIAPPAFHLMVENDRCLSLSTDERVCYARPSVDVLFETAAEAFQERLIAMVLTGANADGSEGLRKVKSLGGTAIVQNPKNAFMDTMPRAALKAVDPDFIVDLDDIPALLTKLCGEP